MGATSRALTFPGKLTGQRPQILKARSGVQNFEALVACRSNRFTPLFEKQNVSWPRREKPIRRATDQIEMKPVSRKPQFSLSGGPRLRPPTSSNWNSTKALMNDRPCAGPCRMLEIQSEAPEI
jgi:hypothetical protein